MSFPLVKRSADFSRGPSASIWAPFNTADFIRNRDLGHETWSDFLAGDTGPFIFWQGTDSTDIYGAADLFGGVVRFSSTTDNDSCGILTRGQFETTNGEVSVTLLGADGAGYLISDTAGAEGMLAFEVRYRMNSVTSGQSNIFMGLVQPDQGGAVGEIISTANAMTDIDFIGFEITEAQPTTIDVIYNLGGGGGETTVTNDVFGSTTGGITGTTANTLTSTLGKWTKLGFLFNPNATRRTDGTNQDRITFFVNGEPLNGSANIVDAGSTAPGIAHSGFPDGRGMVPVVRLMSADGTTTTFDVDWIRCAQFFPPGSQTAPLV